MQSAEGALAFMVRVLFSDHRDREPKGPKRGQVSVRETRDYNDKRCSQTVILSETKDFLEADR